MLYISSSLWKAAKWYEDYRKGCASFNEYRKNGWAILAAKGKITPCKWYAVCPIKAYTEMGRLDRCWIENYCLTANRNCIRFQMEEAGRYHPDNMLPDGRTQSDLRIVTGHFFTGHRWQDAFRAAIVGSLFTGNPINSYIAGAEMLKAGIGIGAVTAFMCA